MTIEPDHVGLPGDSNSTSDLERRAGHSDESSPPWRMILPFIPLYSGVTYDVYRGIRYPFDSVLAD